MEIKNLKIKDIQANPLQPRQIFNQDKLKELANSISEAELLQPIIVRRKDDGYLIVAGERRYKAFQILKENEIPAIIWKAKDDVDALEKSVIENWHREDLTDTEKENVINELWNSGKYKNQNEMVRKTGIDAATISQILSSKREKEELNFTGKSLTYTDMRETKVLKDEPDVRKQVLELRERGELRRDDLREISNSVAELDTEDAKQVIQKVEKKELEISKVREYVRAIKKAPQHLKEQMLKLESNIDIKTAERIMERFPREDQQQVITEEIEKNREGSKENEDVYMDYMEDIAEGEREPQMLKTHDPDQNLIEEYERTYNNVSTISAEHIVSMPKPNQEEAINLLWKMLRHLEREMFKLEEIGEIRELEDDLKKKINPKYVSKK